MTYWYFVVYDYYGATEIGSGNTEISTNIRIASIQHIREIEKNLLSQLQERKPHAEKLFLNNYQLLRTEE